MKTTFGLCLVLAIAYQALAVPAPQPQLFTSLGNILDSINQSGSNFIKGVAAVVGQTQDTIVKTVDPLLNIPKEVVKAGVDSLNQATTAVVNANNQFATRLSNALASLKLPSLKNVAQKISTRISNVAQQIQAPLGRAMLDVVDGLNSLAGRFPDAIGSIVADFEKLVDNVFDNVESLVNGEVATDFLNGVIKIAQDLDALARQFPDATQILDGVMQNINELTTAVKNVYTEVANAAEGAADRLRTIAKDAIAAIDKAVGDVRAFFASGITAFGNLLNGIRDAAVTVAQAKVTAANALINGAIQAANAGIMSLSTVGLEARKLVTSFNNIVTDTIKFGDDMTKAIRDLAQKAIDDSNTRMKKIVDDAAVLFKGLQDLTLSALADGINGTVNCAKAAAEATQANMQNAFAASQACSDKKRDVIQAGIDHVLTQITTALDGNAALNSETSACIKAWKEGASNTVTADCLKKTGKTAQDTLAKLLGYNVQDYINDVIATSSTAANTCFNEAAGLIQDNYDNSVAAFKSCIAGPAA